MNSVLTFQAHKSLLKFRLLQTTVHLEYHILTQEWQLFVKKKQQNDTLIASYCNNTAKNYKQATAYIDHEMPLLELSGHPQYSRKNGKPALFRG